MSYPSAPEHMQCPRLNSAYSVEAHMPGGSSAGLGQKVADKIPFSDGQV